MFTPTIDRTADEAAIHAIVADLESAWNAGDGHAFADHFVEDSDYTVWNGFYVRGKAANIAGHTQLFNNLYKDTQQKMVVRWLRFLSDDIAAVQFDAGIVNTDREWPQVRPLMVVQKHSGTWQIEIFQNTPILPQNTPDGAPS